MVLLRLELASRNREELGTYRPASKKNMLCCLILDQEKKWDEIPKMHYCQMLNDGQKQGFCKHLEYEGHSLDANFC
jgi:hypothetical protein